MKNSTKQLFREMAAIIAVAVGFGLLWNNSLLRDAYKGKAPATGTVPPSAGTDALIAPAFLEQVRELFTAKSAIFVDAREASVFAAGHIAGARSLPLGDYAARIAAFKAEVPVEATLVIYCSGYGCHDSKNLAAKLSNVGYRSMLLYEGGLPEWKDAGLPVTGERP